MADTRFRILSLDGGGIRGVFAASLLAQLEERAGRPITDCFDLVTGTSTGGLLGLGLALGFPARRIVDFYRREGPRIFPSGLVSRTLRSVRHWADAKHDGSVLSATLRDLYGEDTILGGARCPLVITSFDVGAGKPVCFKTQHHKRFEIDWKRKAWEVGMCTASAPTYFRPYSASWGARYVDGGVWANRPSVVGVVEAASSFGVPLAEIDVLAVGTTGAGFRLQRMMTSGKIGWVRGGRVVELLFAAGEASATFVSHLLVDGRFTEYNARLPTPISLDDSRSIPELEGLAAQLSKEHGHEIADRFCSTPCRPRPNCLIARHREVTGVTLSSIT